jgi:hypothetical protein
LEDVSSDSDKECYIMTQKLILLLANFQYSYASGKFNHIRLILLSLEDNEGYVDGGSVKGLFITKNY